jgi:Ca-activated chloride channel family protein
MKLNWRILPLFLMILLPAQAQNTSLKDMPAGISKSSAVIVPKASPAPLPRDGNLPLTAPLQKSIEYSNLDILNTIEPRVIVLVDSSGSMGQLLDKQKSKMFYAKKLFKSYLQDQWREKAQVGMITYGSRRKRDCSDFFMAVKVGEKSLAKIDAAVAKMAPTGMTPIASSLELAIEQLKGYPGPKRVMIFTDGEETCGGDSCKILEKAIQEKVVDLEMFVTGIGLNEKSKDLDKLRCLGKTFGADTPQALQQSLGDINNLIHKSAKNEGGNNLYVDAPDPKAVVKLYSLAGGVRTYLRYFIASYGVKIPPGEYAAEVQLEPVYKFDHFTIPPKRKVTLRVSGVGNLTVKFFDGLLEVEVLNRDKKVVENFLSDETHPVRAGVYDIRIVGQPFFERVEKKFRINPAGNHEIKIDGIGIVQVDYPHTVGIHIYSGADTLVGNYLTNFPFVLKTGTYRFFVNDQCNLEGITIDNQKSLKRLGCPKVK